MRLFVAVNLAEELCRPLAAAQEELRATGGDVKWTDPGGFHLTLKFLGEVDERRVHRVEAALAQAVAGGEPFALHMRGIGGFPSARSPRVVWAGVTAGEPELAVLAAAVEVELTPLGFEPERRAYSAHLTLGRVRSPQGREALAAAMQALAERDFGRMQVERVHLMQSRLSPRGASYSPVQAFELVGR